MAGIAREAAVVSLPPATAPCSPTLRRRQDLSWFRNRPKSPTHGDTAASSKMLAQNLPPVPPSAYNANPTSGSGQLEETSTKPKLEQSATNGVSRMFSSLKRKGGRRRSSADREYLDQLTTQPPLSSADGHLRRRAYSYNGQHVDTIYQTMATPRIPSPRISGEERRRGIDPSVNKATARLMTVFPDIAGELSGLQDFVCTLDHAGVRWYGRIFVGRSCMCFTGTGITFSGTMSTGQRSPPPAYRSNSERAPCMSFRTLSSTPNSSVGSSNQWPTSSVSATSLAAANRPCKPWRKTALKISFHDITRVSKELTMGLWPNAMTLATGSRQYIFTNFLRRDRAYQRLSEAWQLHQQQRKPTEKYPVAVERLPIMSVASRAAKRKSLSKPYIILPIDKNYEQQPVLLPATYSACESESTICEPPSAGTASFVSRQCSTTSSQRTCSRLNKLPIAKGDDEVCIFASMLQILGSNHALLLVMFAMCCLLSLTTHS